MSVDRHIPVLTLDGPGGTGKGAVGMLIARKRGWHYLDSGALYRMVALMADRHDLDERNEIAVARLAREIDIDFRDNGTGFEPWINGEAVGDALRTEECARLASRLAAIPDVRNGLMKVQKEARQAPGLVADGRDMGTRIFPDADAKVFLVASVSVRAQRRYKQLIEKGLSGNLAQLESAIEERDVRDRERSESPMRPAADAMTIDTSDQPLDEVVTMVEEYLSSRLARNH